MSADSCFTTDSSSSFFFFSFFRRLISKLAERNSTKFGHMLGSKCNFENPYPKSGVSDDDDDEIAYFTVRWKTRASFVYRTKNIK